jgi:hypothetical protein
MLKTCDFEVGTTFARQTAEGPSGNLIALNVRPTRPCGEFGRLDNNPTERDSAPLQSQVNILGVPRLFAKRRGQVGTKFAEGFTVLLANGRSDLRFGARESLSPSQNLPTSQRGFVAQPIEK